MPSLVAPVTAQAATSPESVALRGPDGIVTYQELADRALAYGGMLRAHGVSPGDRVLFVAPTVNEFVIAYLGIQAAGATLVPVNPLCTDAEIRYFLEDSGASLSIAWQGLDEAARTASQAMGVAFLPLTPGAPVDDSAPLDAPVEREADDVAAILYTSGTTGRPKGAELTVNNLLSAARISARLAESDSSDRVGTGLPLFHVFGQASVMLSAFQGGASLTLVSPFTPDGMIEAVIRDRLTILAGVPTMWNAMLHTKADVPADAFGALRIAISGGASLAPDINRAFRERFSCQISEGYGLTETAAMATFSRPGVPAPTGTVGPATYEIEVRIGAPGTPDVPVGERGEVFVRGPVVMRGYRNRPEATAETIIDGWLRTGDIGELDADGNLRIVDRAKDLIIRGGYNVYPSEVEHALYEHPDVIEAAVIGIPDEHLGEEIAAVLALREGADLDSAGVRAWAADRLAAYKHPRVVLFLDALPKGPSGKILKREIDQESLVAALADYRAARR